MNWFRYHFEKANLRLQVVLTVDNQQPIISAIQHHMGMGIVTSHLVKKENQTGQIISKKKSSTEIFNQISMVHLMDKIPTHTKKDSKIFWWMQSNRWMFESIFET